MNYTLHQLRIFLKVTETRSITKAAAALHLTQPAVSIQLKNFQKQFEIPLVEVLNKKIFITDFGADVAEAAAVILEGVEAIDQKMHAHKGELTGKLKISAVSTGKYVAPYFLADFMRAHRGVELFLDVTNKAQVLQSLERNEVDFALVSVLPETMQVNKVALLQNKLYLIGNNDRQFETTPYSGKILEELPLIYREPGSGTRYVMEQFVRRSKLPVQQKMELMTNEAVKQAVVAGLGYSIMPLIGLKNELLNGELQIIPVKGFPLKSTWYLIWLKSKVLSPVATAYLDYIRSGKSQIVKEKFEWYEKY